MAGVVLSSLVLAMLPGTAAAEEKATVSSPDWSVPRTAWGDPDLRGKWPIDYLAQTPRQRPEQFGTRAELTDEEYAAALKSAQTQQNLYAREDKAGKIGLGHWSERGLPLRQTSLITEPADGRMPPMTAEGEKRAARMKSSWTEEYWEWVDDFNTFDRCITRGMPSSMLPGVYNSGIEVYQSPGYVAIRLEMIHETRIIPLDGRPAPAPAIQGWLGYSRGHWEGNTLVIETTNFVPGSPIGNIGTNPRPVPNSDQLKMTERLTPTGPDTIRYEAWIEDPVVLTAPFKLDFPWQRNSDYEIYEYACHEGNVQLRGFITSTSPLFAAERAAKWQMEEKKP
ncbi:MAG TPA: hypothetical protein VNS79_15810 [Sphingobium sp.]|nr:hypothetical protein [Sphingobium sp.]